MSNVFIISYTEKDSFDTNLELREIIAVRPSPHAKIRILAVSGYNRIDNISGYFEYDISPELAESPVENSIKVIVDLFNASDTSYLEELIELDQYDLANVQRKIDEDLDPLENPEDLLTLGMNSDQWSNLSDTYPQERKTIFDSIGSYIQESEENEVALIDWLESEYQISLKNNQETQQDEINDQSSANPLSKVSIYPEETSYLVFTPDDAQQLLLSSRLKVNQENIKLAMKEINYFLSQYPAKQLVLNLLGDLFTSTSLRNIFV